MLSNPKINNGLLVKNLFIESTYDFKDLGLPPSRKLLKIGSPIGGYPLRQSKVSNDTLR